jgi:hypothetical protein
MSEVDALPSLSLSLTLKIEVTCSSETSVYFPYSTWGFVSERTFLQQLDCLGCLIEIADVSEENTSFFFRIEE